MNSKNVFYAHAKPFLKWAGGKTWLAPALYPVWQAHKKSRFVDPFCGSLALPLAFRPKKAVLNDANEHLVNLYQQIQQGLVITLRVRNTRDYYLARKNEFNKLIQNGKHLSNRGAELYYYLLRSGFNGLSRFNLSGYWNVPPGEYKSINLLRDFSGYQEILNSWTITNKDFSLIKLRDSDFLYLDPPYYGTFTTYDGKKFTWDDQERLMKWASGHAGPLVMSNSYDKRIVEMYKDYGLDVQKILVRRSISCKGNSRKSVYEVVATNNIPKGSLHLPSR